MSQQAAVRAREAFVAYREGVLSNFFDNHARALAQLYDVPATSMAVLDSFGRTSATEINTLAMRTNQPHLEPRLAPYDAFGRRKEDVDFAAEYHEIGRLVYKTGLMANYATPGLETPTLLAQYVLGQNGEAGHACPVACTAGMIKSLQHELAAAPPQWKRDLLGGWLASLLDENYDTHLHASQFLTEVQGGSDVGANEVSAAPCRDAGYAGWHVLTGEKWFCSAIDAQLWLVVAREAGAEKGTPGLSAFVVPTVLPVGGERNGYAVRRLKEKLGTRSMASAEVDFTAAKAVKLSCDFKKVLELVINTSRLFNAFSNAGTIQRCYLEAQNWAVHRQAFGGKIMRFPAIRASIARLRSEAYGARAVCVFLSAVADEEARRGARVDSAVVFGSGGGPVLAKLVAAGVPPPARRLLVNLNKYWAAKSATEACHTAINVFGGNGAIESFSVLPRLLRDSVVTEQWEGPQHLLCAQVLKDCVRLRLHRPLFELLAAAAAAAGHSGAARAVDEAEKEWAAVVGGEAEAATFGAPAAVDRLRYVVQAVLLEPTSSFAAEHLFSFRDARHGPGVHPQSRHFVRLDWVGSSAVEAVIVMHF